MNFKELYDKAFSVSKETYITKDVEIGSVGCAIYTESGHIYLGKNLNMSCAIGTCAERNAIASMLTNENSKILMMACVHKSGKIITPCGACREFMYLLGDICNDIEILLSLEPLKTISIKELLPNWWRDVLKKD